MPEKMASWAVKIKKKNADKKKSFDMFYGYASACQAVPATSLPLHISPPPSAPAPLSFGHVFNWCLVNLALTMFGERCVA